MITTSSRHPAAHAARSGVHAKPVTAMPLAGNALTLAISGHDEPRAESREPRAESREPRAESREPRAESREPRAESREPRAESREPRAESREPRAESREPRAESREPRAESREPRAESREPRAESREPRAESREPRAESREPRAESREPRAESREPRAESRERSREPRAESLPAALLLALAALLAAPAPAQAQTTVWTATLTPVTASGYTGCTNSASATRCSNTSVLSVDDFTYDGTNYHITVLRVLDSNSRLELEVDTDLTTAAQQLTLMVDGVSFALNDANTKWPRGRRWVSSGLSWTAGTPVSVSLVVPDRTGPALVSATVGATGTELELVLSEPFATPQTEVEAIQFYSTLSTAFSVTANGGTKAFTLVVALQNPSLGRIVLSLSSPIAQGEAVVVSYTDPTAGDDAVALQDALGNETSSFVTGSGGVPAVTNNSTVDRTGPALVSATVGATGTELELVLSEPFATPQTEVEAIQFYSTLSTAFSVTANGGTKAFTLVVALQNPSLGRIVLSLSSPIAEGEAVVVSYTDPTAGDDAVALQDALGNETPSFVTGSGGVPAVTNNSTVVQTAPAQVTGVTVTPQIWKLRVGWTALADAGGYKVQWKSGTEAFAAAREERILDPAAISHVIPMLDGNTEYTVRVVAFVPGAPDVDGTPSEEVAATPLKPTPVIIFSNLAGNVAFHEGDPVSGLVAMTVTFGGDLPMGFEAEDIEITNGQMQRFDISSLTDRVFSHVLITAPTAGEEFSVRIPADVVEGGNHEAVATRTTDTPLTLTMTTTATEPVRSQFSVGFEFSENVQILAQNTEAIDGQFAPDPTGGGADKTRYTNLEYRSFSGTLVGSVFAVVVNPRANFEGEGKIVQPAGSVGAQSNNDKRNVESVFTIRIDTKRPVLQSAAVSGTALVLTYNEPLDDASAPAVDQYSVSVDSADAAPPEVVAVSGSTVTLTLAAAVIGGQTVTVSYAVPTGTDAMPIRDVAGNDAAAFTDWAVTNEGPAVAPGKPRSLRAVPGNTEVTLTWTEPSSDGGAAITGYEYRHAAGTTVPDSTTWSAVAGGGGVRTVVVAGLVNDTEYAFEVRAVNSVGEGPKSGPVTATPSEVQWRLVNGAVAHEGRLELLHNGAWGTICDDYWTDIESDVACRAVGYAGGAERSGRGSDQYRRAHFGQGTGAIWLDDVNCEGDEASPLMCLHRGVGVNNCTHTEDVGVRCSTTTTPRVVSIELSDAPGGNGRYDEGETLEVTLVWSEPVRVSTPAGALGPKVWVGYGQSWAVRAEYASGSGTARTVFAHTLTQADKSVDDGEPVSYEAVQVYSNSLRLRGGAIASMAASVPGAARSRRVPGRGAPARGGGGGGAARPERGGRGRGLGCGRDGGGDAHLQRGGDRGHDRRHPLGRAAAQRHGRARRRVPAGQRDDRAGVRLHADRRRRLAHLAAGAARQPRAERRHHPQPVHRHRRGARPRRRGQDGGAGAAAGRGGRADRTFRQSPREP